MTTIKGLHHAQICIPEGREEAGRAFYCSVLGLPEIKKPAALQARGGFWLQVGDRQVHVGTERGGAPHATRAHLAYEVDDIAAWRAHLEAHAVQISESVPIPGQTRCEFRDPFGNRIELTEIVQYSGNQ